MTDRVARHYRIVGRVQGVFYRGSARTEAQRLGLDGWVRNLTDGSVQAYACGNTSALDEFEQWLEVGPRYAEVVGVEVSEALVEALSGFEVR